MFHRIIPLNAQLRVENEKDVDSAELKLAFLDVDVGRGREPAYSGLYIALVFAREVAPVEPRVIVVVDVDRMDHYIKVGLVAGGRVVELLKFPKRLYSTICPKRGTKMSEERRRIMRCPSCGFGAHRDNMPMT